ncbi:hypothetical protein AHAS_Ahas20G0289700 [Arachis hypogaea]
MSLSNDRDELELCIEIGDSNTKVSSFSHALFINAGTDPFATIHNTFKAVKNRKFLRVIHVGRLLFIKR